MSYNFSQTIAAYPAQPRLSQADLAYRNLRRAIVMWQVGPGAWLTESDLQKLCGFGRTPTREATARLVADGLMSVLPRNGYQVADVTVEAAASLYDVWEALAPMTGRLAAGRVDEAAMISLRAVSTSPPAADVDALVALTEQLFDAILRSTGNPWLRSVGSGLFSHLLRLWVLIFREVPGSEVGDGFARMLTALDAKDPAVGQDAFVEFTAWLRDETLGTVERFVLARALQAPPWNQDGPSQ